jgi:hypothetical protein
LSLQFNGEIAEHLGEALMKLVNHGSLTGWRLTTTPSVAASLSTENNALGSRFMTTES